MSIFKSFFGSMLINKPGLDLNDPDWSKLEGGYRGAKYDASPALKRLEQAKNIAETDIVYEELWQELHHQGDVGVASYYAVPHLIRIAFETKLINYNILYLPSVIEVQRQKNNPPIPKELEVSYLEALDKLYDLALIYLADKKDFESTITSLVAIAVSKRQLKLADTLLRLDSEDVIEEFLENN